MTDLAVMELFLCFEKFRHFFFERAASDLTKDNGLVSLRRSVSDTSLGETDVELVCRNDVGKRTALLVENKIRAPIMPRQFERYQMRGKAGLEAGNWDRYIICLVSPDQYFSTMPADHRAHVDFHMSYEEMLTWLESQSDPILDFKRYLFAQALSDYRKGYVKQPDPMMMAFHHNYWVIASAEFPELRMLKPDVVGKDGTWIFFPGFYGDNGIRLIHKFKVPAAELGIMTRNGEAMAAAILPHLDPSMNVRVTPTWTFVGIATSAIDHRAEFDTVRALVYEGLQALSKLRDFALQPNTMSLIRSHR